MEIYREKKNMKIALWLKEIGFNKFNQFFVKTIIKNDLELG
jgi:uncharacterized caspase-like protein